MYEFFIDSSRGGLKASFDYFVKCAFYFLVKSLAGDADGYHIYFPCYFHCGSRGSNLRLPASCQGFLVKTHPADGAVKNRYSSHSAKKIIHLSFFFFIRKTTGYFSRSNWHKTSSASVEYRF